jgi:hypothetical protein
MSTKLIPQSVLNAKNFFKETIITTNSVINNSKFQYSSEDIQWMTNIWIKNYDKIKENPETYYMVLTLLNRNTKSGKFAIIYNNTIRNIVEKRKDKELVKLFLQPEYPEVFDNKFLSTEERELLISILKKEMLALNLLMKKLENSKMIELVPSNLYNECYIQISLLYEKDIDLEVMKYASFESPNFTMISEYNENTDTYHTYTFDILELLLMILLNENNMYTNKPFSETSIENIISKYKTELKMLKRSYGK